MPEVYRALSVLFNTLVGGSSVETFCGRMYRNEACGSISAHYTRRLIDFIFFMHHKHCEASHRGDVRRAKDTTPFANFTGGPKHDRR